LKTKKKLAPKGERGSASKGGLLSHAESPPSEKRGGKEESRTQQRMDGIERSSGEDNRVFFWRETVDEREESVGELKQLGPAEERKSIFLRA